jgi:putative glutamine amidotransferase
MVTAVLDRVDGLLLTGGEDVNPHRYGAAPRPELGMVSDARDTWEIALVLEAKRRRLPTLAICRGLQLLNVALGGTLIQDIPSERSDATDHHPAGARTARTHAIDVAAESRTARALGVTHLTVNSIHHQAIDRVADGLRVVATAPDGIIEAAESPPQDPWWCVGVQWHPEELCSTPESWDRGLFTAFASALRSTPGA